MLGKLFEVGGGAPYRHPAVWLREPTEERERLRIGAGIGTLSLFHALAAILREPLFLVVVMRVPRVVEAGRWESIPLTHPELERFTSRYGELFEEDARAQLWVGEIDGVGLLVLDEHDLIYAYGPLHKFEQVLRERGYADGRPAGAATARAPLQQAVRQPRERPATAVAVEPDPPARHRPED